MADVTTKNVLSVIATKSQKIKDLPIKSGQLIFIQDLSRIAFDFNGTRVFYNQITELSTEMERLSLVSPLSGYYFVIDTAILYMYKDGWVQITGKPDGEVIFIDVDYPELGQMKENTLYVNKTEREIAIYDSASESCVVVSNYTDEVTDEDIENLFK